MLFNEAINIMRSSKRDSGRRFSVDFVTVDKNRGGSGRLVQLNKCYTIGSSHDEVEHGTITVQSQDRDRPTTIHARLILKVNSDEVYV